MAFSVTNNAVLRSFYGEYQNLAKRSNRSSVSEKELDYADSTALKRAIKSFASTEFNSVKDSVDSTGPVKNFAKKLKAFVDTYNYTRESSSASSNSDLKQLSKKMQKFVDKYSSELKSAGIKIGDDGYLSLSESLEIKTTERYKELFNKDSDFLKGLNQLAGNMVRHIDIVV